MCNWAQWRIALLLNFTTSIIEIQGIMKKVGVCSLLKGMNNHGNKIIENIHTIQ